ncbi:MAG: chemotaxis protein CheD [Bacillota bacterium]
MAVHMVGLGELKVAGSGDLLVAYGLGSCVAVAIYDRGRQLGGMAHVMLAASQPGQPVGQPGKYADTAVTALIEQLLAQGAMRFALEAKLAGGAQLLQLGRAYNWLDIGARNAEASLTRLAACRVRVAATDLGGNYGRTVQLDPATGELTVSTVGRGQRVL